MKSPLVSVVIPTFNRGYCLTKTVTSVLRQSYKNFEILICDDGSTDDSYKIVSAIKDKRVKWIRGTHSGTPAVPRNNGLKNSKGEYIAFLDSDDFWVKDKLKIQMTYLLLNQNIQAACTNAFINQSNKAYLDFDHKKIVLNMEKLLQSNDVISSSMIVHRSIFDKSLGFNEDNDIKGYEDYEKWLKVSYFTEIHLLNIPLIFYAANSEDSIRILKKNDKVTKFLVYGYLLKFLFLQDIYYFIRCLLLLIKIIFFQFYFKLKYKIKAFIMTIKLN
jgi:glycosyltransferase involved in cell wall biosynthesis